MIRILCLHIAGNQASYRYRVEQFLPYWKEYGIEVHPVNLSGISYFEKFKFALASKNYDYVWLQKKPLSGFFVDLIARRSTLIYDYDDALYARESYLEGPPKPTRPGSKQSISRLNILLKRASLVFAGSEALVDYASRFRNEGVFLVPTALSKVPEKFIPGDRSGEPLRVGWIGNNQNLFFLTLIDEVLFSVQQSYPAIRFTLMAGKPPEGLKTRWDFVPWSKEGEASWLHSVDIGIMPLADDEWCRGKCAFKLLQYMSHGKPVIASRVGANRVVVKHGVNGYLASSAAEWHAAFERLVSRPDLRYSMGEESRKLYLASFERQQVQARMAELLHHDFSTAQRNRKGCRNSVLVS
ncbi:MAG: glycosyltransferase family 4 protein [Chlorobiaceae bacterium]|nr:glycosyltransferase family 4 protein [Chlorobiaceae bacterium]